MDWGDSLKKGEEEMMSVYGGEKKNDKEWVRNRGRGMLKMRCIVIQMVRPWRYVWVRHSNPHLTQAKINNIPLLGASAVPKAPRTIHNTNAWSQGSKPPIYQTENRERESGRSAKSMLLIL